MIEGPINLGDVLLWQPNPNRDLPDSRFSQRVVMTVFRLTPIGWELSIPNERNCWLPEKWLHEHTNRLEPA
jgi:hypothetical protein